MKTQFINTTSQLDNTQTTDHMILFIIDKIGDN